MATKGVLTQADINLLKKTFTTKKDLDRFATKNDLKDFATKKDLYRFVTKNDLFNALDEQELKFEAKVIEFKSKFFDKIDPILKEVVNSREDGVIGAEQHRRNEVRIEKLEKIHPQGRHFATI